MPTADELLRKTHFSFKEPGHFEETIEIMKEFAKLHVKAALKEALESIPCLGSSTDIATYEEVEEAVLNSYTEDLVK